MSQLEPFKPTPNQTDFTNIRYCPVINCVVQYKEKILIVKRSSTMNFYPNHWNGIAGFLDDNRSIEDKARGEIGEETGIAPENIVDITTAQPFDQDEPAYKKTWIVHPVLVEVGTDTITLDWEAQEYQWIVPSDLKNFQIVPNFDRVVGSFFQL